jgi:hypothetical protein
MRDPSARSFVITLALLALPIAARAEITQPNGVVMPRDSANGETQLYTLFSSRGEAIDYVADGASRPAVFSPLCDFRATLVLNQTASHLAVGWYNTDGISSVPADPGDIHVIVPVDSPVGTTITGANIRTDPAYAGGLVGFALVGWQTHYTEARLDPVCTTCGAPGPWIMSVIYTSVVTPNAFYVTFEDGPVSDSAGGFGNDGDYNDYVYFFEGLTCMGGGAPCDTGMPGICASGVTQCTATGTSCTPEVTPRDESCDGLDDDCDGSVDEGDGLCSAAEVCESGTCVGACFEFGCGSGYECDASGHCVESACVGVPCPTGEVCRGGACVGPCDGVACPGDLVCRAGRCIDRCAGVTCPAMHVCDRGACVDSCACAGCAPSLSCAASGLCVEPDCAAVDCASMPGTVCRGGACVDACVGASCPTGQTCMTGACVDLPDGGAARDDSGVAATDSGAGSDGGGSGMDGGARGDGGRRPVASGGCCRVVGTRRPEGALALALVLGWVLTRRSRRRS